VISAGGTMNREAVALGTPVWTTFEGRLGAVDRALIAEGRMGVLARPEQIELRKRDPSRAPRIRRDPALLVALALSAA
jgi:predicted glycosyltransferase